MGSKVILLKGAHSGVRLGKIMVEDEDQKIESSEGDRLDSSKCEDGIKTPVDPEIDDHARNNQNQGENLVDELIAERDQLKDQLLRALAETENMRRRTEREMQSARNMAIQTSRVILLVPSTIWRAQLRPLAEVMLTRAHLMRRYRA